MHSTYVKLARKVSTSSTQKHKMPTTISYKIQYFTIFTSSESESDSDSNLTSLITCRTFKSLYHNLIPTNLHKITKNESQIHNNTRNSTTLQIC